MKNQLKIGFALLLLLLVLTVILQNTQVVPLAFLGWHMEMSLVTVITLTFLLGVVAGLLAAAIVGFRRRRQAGARPGSGPGA